MSSKLVPALILVLLLSMLAVAKGENTNMSGRQSIQVWVADPLTKILPNTHVPENPPASVSVDTVRNEYESAQIAVHATKDIRKLVVSVHPVAGKTGAGPWIEANFLGFIPVEKGTSDTPPEHLIGSPPLQIPDPLLKKKFVSVPAGTNQPIWLTIYTPKTTEPGDYTFTASITADEDVCEVPIRVRVHRFTLPDERTLHLTNWFNTGNVTTGLKVERWSERYWKLLEDYARVMAEHRQNVVITPMFELISARDDGQGNLTFDFQRFDRWVALFQKAGVIGTIEGSHLGGRSDWEAKDFNASRPKIYNPDGSLQQRPQVTVSSEEQRQFLAKYLPALCAHLKEKGWFDIYIQHLCDEPIPANAESYKKLSSYVREYAPGMRIIDASMCTEIAGALDIWVPQPTELEQKSDFFAQRKQAGDEIWFYTCLAPRGKYMNRFLDFPLIKTRLLHWANFKYDLTGYLHWGFNYWRGDPFTDLQSDWLPPGDSHLVYPSSRGILSSIRLEALRDGVEDYEMLKILEKKNAKAAHTICDSIVKSWTDYTLDPAVFRAARMRLIKALEKDMAAQPPL